jgi:hypothetical protein
MTNEAVRDKIANLRQPGHCFIKWWGEDESLVDYEILDSFLKRFNSVDGVNGIELFDMEGMWKVLTELDPDPLSREQENGVEVIRWGWKDRQDKEHVTTFPFTPEGIMELMESEFFD